MQGADYYCIFACKCAVNLLNFFIFPAAPRINRDLMPSAKDIKAKVGEEFKIVVPYSGRPIPTVSWTHVSGQL